MPILRRRRHMMIPLGLSFPCISLRRRNWTKITWRLGREWQTESSFLYASLLQYFRSFAFSLFSQTGLFSSTVATFIAISYQSLQQDPHIITQSLLAQISQQLSNTSSSDTSGILNTSIRNSYVPPASVVFVNSAWFVSLVLSLM